MSSEGGFKARVRSNIDAKRSTLAELKRRRHEDDHKTQPSSSARPVTEFDHVVSDLVGNSTVGPIRRSPLVGSDVSPASPMKSIGGGASNKADESEAETGTGATAASDITAVARDGAFVSHHVPELIDVQTELFEFPQKERVYYTKEVQTASLSEDDDDSRGQDPTEAAGGVGSETREARTEEAIRAKILKEQAEEAALRREEEQLDREIEEQLRELTEDERLAIYGATDFTEFVEQSSKIVERALADTYDYMKDYTIAGGGMDEVHEGRQLRLARTFWDEKVFGNRSITDLDWSTHHPELCVASYNRNDMANDDPDGLVAIWNMHLRERPEFVFHAQTDVLSVRFSPFQPNLVIGGTYSGQILIWDTRARALPVLKTPLSAAGHTHPVYSLNLVGTQNAHNLITASTDGNVCSWMLDMLASPQETMLLLKPSHPKTDEVGVTTLAFPDQETTNFWIGTEEGNVYSASRYDRAGLKAGLNTQDVYRGHSAPITGLHFHPLSGAVDFSDLFLTASMDWTTKLWRAKSGPASAHTRGGTGATRGDAADRDLEAVLSFEEASDYVYDIKWHPFHPAVFAQVDGSGRLDVFNLNLDTERPVQSTTIPTGRALNKLAWDRKEGRRLSVGGADGKVYVYDVGEQFCNPSDDEVRAFQSIVAGLLKGGAGGGAAVEALGSATGGGIGPGR